MNCVSTNSLAFKNYVNNIKINRYEVLTFYDFIRILETDYDCRFIIDSEPYLQFSNPADATIFVIKWS